MSGHSNNKDLLNKINQLRKMLEDNLNIANKPTEEEVVRISQELDELIVSYYKQIDDMRGMGLSE